MASNRRRKISWIIVVSLLAVVGVMFYFRYDLMLRFQLWRIGSLHCESSNGRSDEPCIERVWAHRVNSTGRYQLLSSHFKGMETDIVFDSASASFAVYHPPLLASDKSLSLDSFLAQVDLNRTSLWLDMRAVDSANAPMALQAISFRPWSESLKEGSIIELYNVSAAQYFAANGYRVSLNLSGIPRAMRNRQAIVTTGLEKRIRLVQYVSQGYEMLPLLKELFPGKKIVTWDPRIGSFFHLQRLQRLLDDPMIDIVLVNIKSRYRK